MEQPKTLAEQKREALFYRKKNGYDRISPEERQAMTAYCAGYKRFLDEGKTERDAVSAAISLAEDRGFRPYVRGMALHPGDKVYYNNRGKSLMLAVIGQQNLSTGAHIGAAHIDSPRLDLKPSPLYEEDDLAFFKTHYYGGLRKYQWVTTPLELRGVVALTDGRTVPIRIGHDPDDLQLLVTDLLPHLGEEQSKATLDKAFPGEILNILIGSEPFPDSQGSDRVKLMVMDLLHEKYGFTEEDFISAELSAVPAYPARDVGLDRSMVGGYGQDDRVCGYAALTGLLEAERYPKTAVVMLVDKEEIGSTGVSGMKSQAFDTFMADLCAAQGVELRVCYEHSICLSADVTAAYDPNYASAYEKRNSALVNYGVGFSKYTGAGGKYDCNDASAELVAYFRRLMDENGVLWQMAELGKVDGGGGGTVACYMGDRNIATMDAGVPVLCMHAPFEVTGKLDCYMSFRSMKALFEAE
ncbi:MAG: aminopeptidase [Oscillospiraceae bacterium]|nr:aminopeptidase [Oscillospiraceae bacterium]